MEATCTQDRPHVHRKRQMSKRRPLVQKEGYLSSLKATCPEGRPSVHREGHLSIGKDICHREGHKSTRKATSTGKAICTHGRPLTHRKGHMCTGKATRPQGRPHVHREFQADANMMCLLPHYHNKSHSNHQLRGILCQTNPFILQTYLKGTERYSNNKVLVSIDKTHMPIEYESVCVLLSQ